MARTVWPVMEPPIRVATHGSQTEPSAYGGRVQDQSYDSIDSGALGLRRAGTIGSYSHLPPRASSRLDLHMHDHIQSSCPLSAPYYGEFSPHPHTTHPLYSISLVERGFIDSAPTTRNPAYPKPSEPYDPWTSYLHSPSMPQNATSGFSPVSPYHSALGPSLYPNSLGRQFPWPTEHIQMGAVQEVSQSPTVYDLPGSPLPDSAYLDLDSTSEPCSETLEASYPCQWTKGDVICNVMVQATRSHMNRHLHAYHGFGGSDARQTRCYWIGCGATMQQGSIARHMVTCHLQAKVTCPMCFKKLSRQDVISKHQRVCPAAGTWR